jgi:hypothetical protein
MLTDFIGTYQRIRREREGEPVQPTPRLPHVSLPCAHRRSGVFILEVARCAAHRHRNEGLRRSDARRTKLQARGQAHPARLCSPSQIQTKTTSEPCTRWSDCKRTWVIGCSDKASHPTQTEAIGQTNSEIDGKFWHGYIWLEYGGDVGVVEGVEGGRRKGAD